MPSFTTLAWTVIGAAAVVAAASDVHDLKTDSFGPFIKEHDLVLAEFYAPWCGHCKALAPEYEVAATTLKEKNVALAKIDCTEEADLCQQYGVEGYPTIKIFRGPDQVSPYNGARKAPAIISFMTKQALPAVSILIAAQLEEFKTADKVVLVAYLTADDKTSNATYTEVAEKLRDTYIFGAVHDDAVAKAEGVKVPSIVLYKQFDEGKDVFDGNFEVEAIAKFAKTAATPLVGEVGPETYADYMAAGIPLAYVFAETAEERTALAKELKPVAEKFRGQVSIATIDAKAFGAHAGNLNLDAEKFPAFAIQETVKNQKFPFSQEKKITAEAITEFVQDFLDGKIEPSIKSEPIPEKQEGPVQVVVAHNYKDIVMDADKDVLLEFYAPWCGHCKSLAPKYEELASLYASNADYAKKVVIAKVDATLNDVPDEIQGFPTIKLFPAGSKDSPITYSGARTIKDLAAFVKEQGKYKIDVEVPSDDADAEMPDAEPMGKAAPAASKKASEGKEKVKEASKAAKDAATDATKDAKAKVEAAAEDAKAKVHDTTEKAKATAEKAKATAEKAKATAAKVKDGVKDKVKSKISEAAEAVKTMVTDTDDEEHDEL